MAIAENDPPLLAGIDRPRYVVAGSSASDERATAIYSHVSSADLNDLEPEAYLRFVMERIAEHSVNRVDELLTWAVAEQLAIATGAASEIPLAA